MRLCINCYTENPRDAIFCPRCGMKLVPSATGEEAAKAADRSAEDTSTQLGGKEESRPQPGPPPVGDTATGQTRLAYRLAAIVLFMGAFVTFIGALATGGTAIYVELLPFAIDLALGLGLLRFSARARLWVIVIALLEALVWPILSFLRIDPFSALVMSAMYLAQSSALVLLLTGQTRTWRLGLALAIFAGFTLGPFTIGLLTTALVWLVRG
jgi:hypothetical protein